MRSPDRPAASIEPEVPVEHIETVMCAYYDPSCIETRKLAEAAAHVQDWLDAVDRDKREPVRDA